MPLRPFLTTFADPQKKHFFNHISDNLCKDIKISALHGFYPTFCQLGRFIYTDTLLDTLAMGFLGMGINPLVGATVAVAVAVEQALS